MANEDGVPIDELRSHIYFEGIGIRDDAQKLLQRCRLFEITFRKSLRRGSLHDLSKEYDALYQRYIKHEAQVSSYVGMVSNPFERNEEGNQVRKNIELVILLNTSAQGLTSQRETIQLVLGDISNQLRELDSEANSKFVNAVAVLSFVVALVSLVVSLVALFKIY